MNPVQAQDPLIPIQIEDVEMVGDAIFKHIHEDFEKNKYFQLEGKIENIRSNLFVKSVHLLDEHQVEVDDQNCLAHQREDSIKLDLQKVKKEEQHLFLEEIVQTIYKKTIQSTIISGLREFNLNKLGPVVGIRTFLSLKISTTSERVIYSYETSIFKEQ
jgi:hypothetical protein